MAVPFLFMFGIAFWIFLTVAAVAGMVAEYKKRKMEIEPLRAAIERGQQLDPAIIERLMAREHHDRDLQPIHLRIAGIIAVASGIGLGLFSPMLHGVAMVAVFPVLGSGVLVMCVGIGLLVAARAVERHQAKGTTETSAIVRGPGA